MSEINMNTNNNEKNIKCERCQSEEATIICHTCQPFHNFCHRCDSIIHSMKLKTNHIREPYSPSLYFQNAPSTIVPNSQDAQPLNNTFQKSLTPERQYNRSTLNENKNNKYNLNTYDPQKNDVRPPVLLCRQKKWQKRSLLRWCRQWR